LVDSTPHIDELYSTTSIQLNHPAWNIVQSEALHLRKVDSSGIQSIQSSYKLADFFTKETTIVQLVSSPLLKQQLIVPNHPLGVR
jgi:hypothetical protein